MNIDSSSSSSPSYGCLIKQDSLPRRPRRANSPERFCTMSDNFKAVRRVSYADSVSDLSLSSAYEGSSSGCESICSFLSFDDLSTILNHSTTTTTPSSSESSSSTRKFSTISRLSLFSSQPHEKKKTKKKKSTRGGRKPEKKDVTTVNRWDSWKNDERQGSPVKPERKAIVDSRWSSHSSRAPIASPRRSSSLRRISFASDLAVAPLMLIPQQQEKGEQQALQQDIVFHPQSSSTQRLSAHPQQPPHRAVLTRRPKARNLVLEAAVVPNRFPRHKAILTERDHETIRKLKSTWESRRSVATTSTRDSGASSTASPDYSIPWFSSSLQQHRPTVLKKK